MSLFLANDDTATCHICHNEYYADYIVEHLSRFHHRWQYTIQEEP